MAEFIPFTVNNYYLQEEIGSGGHGIVYKAQASNGMVCAVKRVQPQDDDKLLKRIEIEAQIIRDLQHPHIVHLYDYWQDDNGVWLVMNWLPTDLRKYLAKQHPLPLARIAEITDDIAGALAVAHAAEIVHRDLKPDNILMDDDGRAYLTDFGIAKRLGYTALTSMGIVVGSPAYLTPEQIMGTPITPQTDIYAFGILLYEMVSGEHPFVGIKSHMQLMMMLAQSPLPPVHLKRTDIAEAITIVIHKATSIKPEDRYESTLAMAQAFREAAQV